MYTCSVSSSVSSQAPFLEQFSILVIITHTHSHLFSIIFHSLSGLKVFIPKSRLI